MVSGINSLRPSRQPVGPSDGLARAPKAARGAVGATEAAAKERAAQERAMTLIDMDDSDATRRRMDIHCKMWAG